MYVQCTCVDIIIIFYYYNFLIYIGLQSRISNDGSNSSRVSLDQLMPKLEPLPGDDDDDSDDDPQESRYTKKSKLNCKLHFWSMVIQQKVTVLNVL